MAWITTHELGWKPDLIELPLAHAEHNEVRGAYNRGQRMAERRQMMQRWPTTSTSYETTLRNEAGVAQRKPPF